MKDWGWLTPLGVISAALIAGAFLTWNNRQRPHDVLKVLVEIYDKLPESDARAGLLVEIERRLKKLTSAKPGDPDGESPFETEFDDEFKAWSVPNRATAAAVAGIVASLIVSLLPWL